MNIRAHTMLLVALLFPKPLTAQQPIPLGFCAESTTWVRPSPDVQAKIWNMGRYQGMPREPYEWTHAFIVVDDPLSASIAYDVRNLTGLWTDPPSFDKCDTNLRNRREGGNEWIEMWVLLHRVVQVTRENNTYTVMVEPTGKGFQLVYIRRLNPSVVFRFVTIGGKELERWDESAPPNRPRSEVPPGTRIIGPNGEIIRKTSTASTRPLICPWYRPSVDNSLKMRS
jgi:hypothetical protein